jgi:hypothetical protein
VTRIQRYRWFHKATPYTNAGSNFVVVVGSDFTLSNVQGDLALIQIGGVTIDAWAVDNATAVGFEIEVLPRRMLIPPGGVYSTGGAGEVSLVECLDTSDIDGKDSLENAANIL